MTIGSAQVSRIQLTFLSWILKERSENIKEMPSYSIFFVLENIAVFP